MEYSIEFTRERQRHILDVRDYGNWKDEASLGGDDNDRQWALDILSDIFSAGYFTTSGTRNDNAVDACCALHLLGCKDPDVWFYGFFKDFGELGFKATAINIFLDHVLRVIPYLDEWGPEGYEMLVENYTIDY